MNMRFRLKLLWLLLTVWFRPQVIIAALPSAIANGQIEDAVPVMANFNWILAQVNANAAQLTLTPQLAAANVFALAQSGVAATLAPHFPIASQIQNDGLTWVAAGGTANAITATYAPVVAAVADGQRLGFRALAANTSATVTFSPNGLTARNITRLGGKPLTVGYITPAMECVVRYNQANTRWELLGSDTDYELVYAEITANVTPIIGANFANADDVVTCGATTFDGTPCYVEFFAPGVVTDEAGVKLVFTLVDGVTDVGILGIAVSDTASVERAVFLKRKFTPPAGAKTYKVNAYLSSGTATGTVFAGTGLIGAYAPAYLRFTKA
jgi:hypothetical protein